MELPQGGEVRPEAPEKGLLTAGRGPPPHWLPRNTQTSGVSRGADSSVRVTPGPLNSRRQNLRSPTAAGVPKFTGRALSVR